MENRIPKPTINYLVVIQRAINDYIEAFEELVMRRFDCPVLLKAKCACLHELETALQGFAKKLKFGINLLLADMENLYYLDVANSLHAEFCPMIDIKRVLVKLQTLIEDMNFECDPILHPKRLTALELQRLYSVESIRVRASFEAGSSNFELKPKFNPASYMKRIDSNPMLCLHRGVKIYMKKPDGLVPSVQHLPGYYSDGESTTDDSSDDNETVAKKPCIHDIEPYVTDNKNNQRPEQLTPEFVDMIPIMKTTNNSNTSYQSAVYNFERIEKNKDGFFKVIPSAASKT